MQVKGTVLIAQSDERILKALEERFVQAGYRVVTINEAAQIAGAVHRQMPQALILDMDMPGLDAAALIQEVRASPRTHHIHITLLTPRGEQQDKLDALAAGADEFMCKPVDMEELGLRVRNALRRAAFDNLVNPVTGLPGPRLIEEQLRQMLRRTEQGDWALIHLSLRGLETFEDVYGFLACEEVLRFAAHLFGQVVDRLGTPDDFIGHSGNNSFIVISTPDRAKAMAAELTALFDEGVKAHYSFRERERGYIIFQDAEGREQRAPLMRLDARIITAAEGPFSDIRELTQMLG